VGTGVDDTEHHLAGGGELLHFPGHQLSGFYLQVLETSKRLIAAVPEGMHRFLFDAFSIEERLTKLLGASGVDCELITRRMGGSLQVFFEQKSFE